MPKVEDVATELAGPNGPELRAVAARLLHIGEKFQESNSTSLTMVVLEADHPLDDQDHQYYDDLMQRLKNDTQHVQYVMDLWGKPITAAGAQSIDGKATYVLLRLAGDIGQIQANQSVECRPRHRRQGHSAAGTQGLRQRCGADGLGHAVDRQRQPEQHHDRHDHLDHGDAAAGVPLASNVRCPCQRAVRNAHRQGRRVDPRAFRRHPVSSFAVNIVVSLTLGAGTDYGIFLLGRYQEARQLGETREEAYFTAYRGVAPIIIGSGLTIAGAGFCLSFARLDYFHTMGPAVAISMLFTIAAALTLGPAMLTVGSLFGLFDPKR